MLNYRSKQILLKMLETKKSINIRDVANSFNVTERTIRNDLDEIDQLLKSYSYPLLQKNITVEVEFSKPLLESEKFNDFINEIILENSVFNNSTLRQAYMYVVMFRNEQKITIDYLEREIDVSRSTINTDIKKLKKSLEKYQIEIIYSKKDGFFLQGKENVLRKLFIQNSMFLEEENIKENYLNESIENNFLNKWLYELEKDLEKVFSLRSLLFLKHFLYVSVDRIKKDHTISDKSLESKFIKDTLEYRIVSNKKSSIEDHFSIVFNENEVAFFTSLLLNSNLIKDDTPVNKHKIDIYYFVYQFLINISKNIAIDISKDDDLYSSLFLHFQTTLFMEENKIEFYSDSVIIQNMKAKYIEIYEKVYKSLYEIDSEYKEVFLNETEMVYITIHIVAALEKVYNSSKTNLRVLTICHMGIGTSKFLQYNLNNKFNFQFVEDKGEYTHLQDIVEKEKVDLIISTIPIENTNIEQIVVSPLLNSIDIEKIRVLEKEIIQKKAKYKNLHNCRKEHVPVLKELITEDTIELNIPATSWEEAIRKGGELLLRNESIRQEYIEAMVASVKKYGPYIVIAPGVAMAHARPDDGVNKIGFSLITLDTPVEFGNEENDPVEIVVTIAAIDHSTHLKALSELSEFIDDSKFINIVKNAVDKKEILDYINQ